MFDNKEFNLLKKNKDKYFEGINNFFERISESCNFVER